PRPATTDIPCWSMSKSSSKMDYLGPSHHRRFRAHHAWRRLRPTHRAGRLDRLFEPHRQRGAALPSGGVDVPNADGRGCRRAGARRKGVEGRARPSQPTVRLKSRALEKPRRASWRVRTPEALLSSRVRLISCQKRWTNRSKGHSKCSGAAGVVRCQHRCRQSTGASTLLSERSGLLIRQFEAALMTRLDAGLKYSEEQTSKLLVFSVAALRSEPESYLLIDILPAEQVEVVHGAADP